jgi:hypothetical protein
LFSSDRSPALATDDRYSGRKKARQATRRRRRGEAEERWGKTSAPTRSRGRMRSAFLSSPILMVALILKQRLYVDDER